MTSLPGANLAPDELVDARLTWPAVRVSTCQGRVSDFVTDEVGTPSGQTVLREYLLHPGAVAVIACDDAGRVAVVDQYRHPAGFRLLEPPAGLLDVAGESFLAAAQRELAEEAGLAAADWRVLVDLFTSPGCSTESVRVFLARDLRPAPAPDGFRREAEEALMSLGWARLEDVVDAVYAGRVQNSALVSGVLALYGAQLSGRLDHLREPEAPWPARRPFFTTA